MRRHGEDRQQRNQGKRVKNLEAWDGPPLPSLSEFPINLRLPPLTGGPADIPSLIVRARDLQKKDLASTYHVDFADVKWCSPAALVFIGAALRATELRGSAIKIRTDSIASNLQRLLKQNGFLSAFGVSERVPHGTTISYREDRALDVNSVVNYLKTDLLARDFLRLPDEAQGEIAGVLAEIYVNAFDHAESPVGVVSCGHYSRRTNRAQFAAVDLGKGIVTSVRRYLRRGRHRGLDDVDSLKWAFERGHTTKPGREPRGNGLPLLQDFITRYHGFMEIRSNAARVLIKDSKTRFEPVSAGVRGTLVRITLDCDRSLFLNAEEDEDDLEF